jgi:hypothetical protein
MTNSAQIALSIFTAAGAIYVLMIAMVKKHALEWKHRARVCPSCGLDARSCRCRRLKQRLRP